MAATRKVKGQTATNGILVSVQMCTECAGADTNTPNTHTHTNSPFLLQQRADERACSSIWRGGGRSGRMGGCWVEERGCGECERTDWQTDNKRPSLPQSSKPPFQPSISVHSVHTNRHNLTGSLFAHRQSCISNMLLADFVTHRAFLFPLCKWFT